MAGESVSELRNSQTRRTHRAPKRYGTATITTSSKAYACSIYWSGARGAAGDAICVDWSSCWATISPRHSRGIRLGPRFGIRLGFAWNPTRIRLGSGSARMAIFGSRERRHLRSRRGSSRGTAANSVAPRRRWHRGTVVEHQADVAKEGASVRRSKGLAIRRSTDDAPRPPPSPWSPPSSTPPSLPCLARSSPSPRCRAHRASCRTARHRDRQSLPHRRSRRAARSRTA
jgi:hypothetical protein